MNTTTQSVMIYVKVQKDHGLGNQHPSLTNMSSQRIIDHLQGKAVIICEHVLNAVTQRASINFQNCQRFRKNIIHVKSDMSGFRRFVMNVLRKKRDKDPEASIINTSRPIESVKENLIRFAKEWCSSIMATYVHVVERLNHSFWMLIILKMTGIFIRTKEENGLRAISINGLFNMNSLKDFSSCVLIAIKAKDAIKVYAPINVKKVQRPSLMGVLASARKYSESFKD